MGKTASDGFLIRAMRAGRHCDGGRLGGGGGLEPGPRRCRVLCARRSGGFLIGEVDGKPVAVVSAVNYDDHFAFLGFFIVRPELRGHSYGLQVSQAALAHAGSRTMGLDGVVEQQDNYAKSGFALRLQQHPLRRRADRRAGRQRDGAAVGGAVRCDRRR